MARKPRSQSEGREPEPAGGGSTEPPRALVSVAVPHNTSITIKDLKNLTAEERAEFLNKAKTAKVGFVILNAPFKTRLATHNVAAKATHDS